MKKVIISDSSFINVQTKKVLEGATAYMSRKKDESLAMALGLSKSVKAQKAIQP